MSLEASRGRQAPVDDNVCEWCGGVIDARAQECPARGDGRRCEA